MQWKKTRFSGGSQALQFRLIISYFVIIAFVLILLNVYPTMASQRMVFQSKQSQLTNAASIFTSNLAGLTTLDEDNARGVVEFLKQDNEIFVLLTNPRGKTIYASPGIEQIFNVEELKENAPTALEGNDLFQSHYERTVFLSCAVQPVMEDGRVRGILYVCERDEEKGAQIYQLIRNLHTISWIIILAAAVGSIFSTRVMTKRVDRLVEAVQSMGRGKYSSRLSVTGNDELSTLTREFNELMVRLDDADRVQKRFVADASHELKTPLASIRLLADSLLQNPEIDRELEQEFLNDINMEVDRLSHITEELLILTRLESDMEVRSAMLDVRDIVAEVFHTLEPQAQQMGVRLESGAEEALLVRSNSDDLFHIVKNLVENGIKYNVPGGFVRVTLRNEENCEVLLVEDSGIGIPEELRPLIFQRFYRVDRARSRSAGGTGLGLSIVWNAVVKWNGSIHVGAREEGGTWFRVEFPREQEALPVGAQRLTEGGE